MDANDPPLHSRHAAPARGLGDRLRYRGTDARVERRRDDIVLGEFIARKSRQRFRRRDLHLFVNVARAHVERAAENAREREHVVDLVRIVAASGGDDPCAARLRRVGEYLRRRVRAGENDRVLVHRFDHLGRDGVRRGNADKHVRAHQHIGERPRLAAQVRDLGHLGLDPVQPLAALVDRALAVAHCNVFETCREQQLRDGDGRRARAGGDDLHVLFLLPNDLERVREARERDNGGAVLVIVEDENVTFFLQLALDLKAAWCRDVLQIDAAEAAGNVVDGLHKLVHVLGLDADGESVHIAEGLEEHALALHDGHTGLGADVAEAQDGAAVGDDRRHVPAAGKLIALARILLDLEARLRDAGRVGQGQIVLRLDRHAGHHLDLALPLPMQS